MQIILSSKEILEERFAGIDSKGVPLLIVIPFLFWYQHITMKSKEQFKSEVVLILVTLIWGGTFPVIKAGLDDISPLLMVVTRFFIAFLFFLPIIIKKRKSISKGLIKAGIILGFSTFVG